jgi:hypothetical protein
MDKRFWHSGLVIQVMQITVFLLARLHTRPETMQSIVGGREREQWSKLHNLDGYEVTKVPLRNLLRQQQGAETDGSTATGPIFATEPQAGIIQSKRLIER